MLEGQGDSYPVICTPVPMASSGALSQDEVEEREKKVAADEKTDALLMVLSTSTQVKEEELKKVMDSIAKGATDDGTL